MEFKFEPTKPDREHDFVVRWNDHRGEHEQRVWCEEGVFSGSRCTEDGGGIGYWNFRESGDEKVIESQNNRFGNWMKFHGHTMQNEFVKKYLNFMAERILL
jgi:hypothetical protein